MSLILLPDLIWNWIVISLRKLIHAGITTSEISTREKTKDNSCFYLNNCFTSEDDGASQVADHTEAEEPLVSGDVVDRRGRVPRHEQLAGNIDETQGAENDQEQVPESRDSPRVVGRAHVLSL